MGEDDVVRIPIILDVEGEGEIDNLHSKLLLLKQKLDSINTDRNIKPSKSGQMFAQEIYNAIEAIGRYEEALSQTKGEDIFEEEAKEATRYINIEIERINEFISKNRELRAEFSKTMPVDTFSGRISDIKELDNYMESLKQTLDDVNKRFNKDANSESRDVRIMSGAIQSEIEDIQALVQSLGEVSAEWANVQKETDEANKSMRDTTRFMRQQFGKLYSSGESFETGVSSKDLDVLAERNEKYNEAIELNQQMKDEAIGTSNRIVDAINDEITVLNRLIKRYSEVASEATKSGKARQRASIAVPVTAERASNASASKNAEKAAVDITKAQIQALRDEESAIKQSTSQYYYKLRAVKMLGFTFNNVTNAINKFDKATINVASRALKTYLKLIPGVSRLQKALSKATVSQKKFNKELSATNKSSKQFNFSLKDLMKNLLKYGIGIRSLFVLFNKLRNAMMSGLGEMAKQFESVNAPMSSLLTSLTQMGNAIATVAQPIVNVLAPILEKLSALFTEVTYKIASFIAALTGKSTVFKAIRVQKDYAASLDKTAKSAKDAKKELSGLDKLNVINSDKDGGAGDVGAAFEEVPIDDTMAGWADKFKKFLNDLLAPIKAAWDKVKDYVIGAWTYMCGQLKALWADVARDFWRVWGEAKTEKMFEYIFLAIGDIMMIIGSLAKKIREAWNYAENGYRILKALRDICYEIAKHIHDITSYTRDWVERELNLKPLFTAIADVLNDKIVPAVRRVLDLVVYLFNMGFLELLRDFINTNLPVLVRGAGEFAEGIGLIAKRIQMALETGTKVDGAISYTRSRLQQILDKFEHFGHLVSETFKTMGEDFKKWAAELDFRPLFDSIIKLLSDMTPLVEALFGKFEWIDGKFQHTDGLINKIWKETILPFWKFLIEGGENKDSGLPGLISTIGDILKGIDWEHFTKVAGELIETLEPFFELAWNTLLQIIADLGKKFDDFVNSDSLDKIVEKFKAWVDGADPGELATKIEHFAEVMIAVTGAFNLFSKVFLPIVTNAMTFINFMKQAKMTKGIAEISGKMNLLTKGMGAVTKTPFLTFMSRLAGALANPTALLSQLGTAISTIALPIAIAVAAIATMIAAFGGLDETLAAIKQRVDDVVKYLKEFAQNIGLSDMIDGLKEKLGGLKESFGSIFGSLEQLATKLRPMYEAMFDKIAAIAKFIGGELIAVIDGLGTSLGGVIDFLSGFFDIIGGIAKILTGDFSGGIKQVSDGFGKELKGILEVINGLLTFLLDSFANLVGVVFPGFSETISSTIKGIKDSITDWIDETSKSISKWIEDVINLFLNLKNRLIGDPIVIDLQNGIVQSFGEWISETATEVGGWVKDRVNDFVDLASGIGEEAKKMKDKVVEKFTELKENAGTKADELKQTAEEKFSKVRERIQDNLATDKFTQFGKNAIKGVENGIKQFGAVISAASTNVNNLKSKFREGLSASTFRSIGSNVINALTSGLKSGLSSALSAISGICSQITDKVKSSFQIHSPSRVFMNIGEMLMKGLVVGVDDGSEEVEDAFSGMIPSDEVLDSFYTSFIDMVSNLTRNSTAMFDEMFLHIEESMQNLEKLMAMSNMYQSLDNMPQMKLPDIVNGYTLPSNKEFKQNSQEFDVSKLTDVIKDAVIDAITSTIDLRDNDETVIVNIDGKELFQVVRNKNSEYKKQHGVSAFT